MGLGVAEPELWDPQNSCLEASSHRGLAGWRAPGPSPLLPSLCYMWGGGVDALRAAAPGGLHLHLLCSEPLGLITCLVKLESSWVSERTLLYQRVEVIFRCKGTLTW